jgi:hypothetical protein
VVSSEVLNFTFPINRIGRKLSQLLIYLHLHCSDGYQQLPGASLPNRCSGCELFESRYVRCTISNSLSDASLHPSSPSPDTSLHLSTSLHSRMLVPQKASPNQPEPPLTATVSELTVETVQYLFPFLILDEAQIITNGPTTRRLKIPLDPKQIPPGLSFEIANVESSMRWYTSFYFFLTPPQNLLCTTRRINTSVIFSQPTCHLAWLQS